MTELLSVDSLEVDDGRGRALVRQVSLRVSDGEAVGLVGESGFGKSLTAKSILGILPGGVRLKSGQITYKGREISKARRREVLDIRGKEIGYVPQDPQTALDPLFRIEDQVTEGVRLHGSGPRARRYTSEVLRGFGLIRPGPKTRSTAVELLRRVEIDNPAQRVRQFPLNLSGGMRQRVVIAAAIAMQPRLLVADEPTTALDATVERKILDLINDIRENLGMALVMISHDLDVIAWTCERAYVMLGGHIVETAPVQQLFSAPLHPYTQFLLAASSTIRGGTWQSSAKPVEDAALAVEPAPRACPFVARCPRASAVCGESFPEVTEAGATHQFWCYHPL